MRCAQKTLAAVERISGKYGESYERPGPVPSPIEGSAAQIAVE